MFTKMYAPFANKYPLLAGEVQNRTGSTKAVCRTIGDHPPPSPATSVLYVCGAVFLDKALFAWLAQDSERAVVIVENQMARVVAFMQDSRSHPVLRHPQIKTVWLFDVGDQGLEESILPFAFRSYECITPYDNRDKHFSYLITLLHAQHEADISLYKDFGIPETANIIANLQIDRPIYDGTSLRGAYEGIPAIICGAGPSLQKSLPELGEAVDKAALFAGGSAMDLLYEAGIPFRFGGMIDPDPCPKHYRYLAQSDAPLFYRNQTSGRLLATVKAPLICMGGSPAFLMEEWLVPALVPMDIGFHVGTFLIRVAEYLGFSPILLVGMDGCREKGKEDKVRDRFAVIDRFGNPALSRSDFILGSAWIRDFAATHPKARIMNATQGGMTIEGVKEVRPAQTLQNSLPISPLPLRDKLACDPERIDLFYDSLRNVLRLCRASLADPSRLSAFHAGLQSEPFARTVLYPLWKVWNPLLPKTLPERKVAVEDPLRRLLFYHRVVEEYGDRFGISAHG